LALREQVSNLVRYLQRYRYKMKSLNLSGESLQPQPQIHTSFLSLTHLPVSSGADNNLLSLFFFSLHNFAGHISVLDEKESLLRPHHALQSGEVRSSDLAPEESGALVYIYLEPSIFVFPTAHVDNDVQGEQPRGRPSS